MNGHLEIVQDPLPQRGTHEFQRVRKDMCVQTPAFLTMVARGSVLLEPRISALQEIHLVQQFHRKFPLASFRFIFTTPHREEATFRSEDSCCNLNGWFVEHVRKNPTNKFGCFLHGHMFNRRKMRKKARNCKFVGLKRLKCAIEVSLQMYRPASFDNSMSTSQSSTPHSNRYSGFQVTISN